MELKDLKKGYDSLAGKYKLPSFEELNEGFEIEKIERESDALLRTIRKVMMEKVVNSLGFIEMLLNPMNAPRMYHAYIKSIGTEDKKIIEKIYGVLAEISVESLEREIEYDEKEEAELIKKTFKIWNEMKPEFAQLVSKIKKPDSSSLKKERSYFG